MNDHPVVFGKLRHLINLPHLTVGRGLTQKYHRPALAAFFVVDLGVIQFNFRHDALLCSSIGCIVKQIPFSKKLGLTGRKSLTEFTLSLVEGFEMAKASGCHSKRTEESFSASRSLRSKDT